MKSNQIINLLYYSYICANSNKTNLAPKGLYSVTKNRNFMSNNSQGIKNLLPNYLNQYTY